MAWLTQYSIRRLCVGVGVHMRMKLFLFYPRTKILQIQYCLSVSITLRQLTTAINFMCKPERRCRRDKEEGGRGVGRRNSFLFSGFFFQTALYAVTNVNKSPWSLHQKKWLAQVLWHLLKIKYQFSWNGKFWWCK